MFEMWKGRLVTQFLHLVESIFICSNHIKYSDILKYIYLFNYVYSSIFINVPLLKYIHMFNLSILTCLVCNPSSCAIVPSPTPANAIPYILPFSHSHFSISHFAKTTFRLKFQFPKPNSMFGTPNPKPHLLSSHNQPNPNNPHISPINSPTHLPTASLTLSSLHSNPVWKIRYQPISGRLKVICRLTRTNQMAIS